MVVCEGCEVYFARRLPNGDYLLRGNTLTGRVFVSAGLGGPLVDAKDPKSCAVCHKLEGK